eukprot:11467923-Karenia_brevis.AAC.1
MQSLAQPGPQADCVKWLTERDRQTTVKARALYSEGWPWEEALMHVCEWSMAELWTVGNLRPSQSIAAVLTSMQGHLN